MKKLTSILGVICFVLLFYLSPVSVKASSGLTPQTYGTLVCIDRDIYLQNGLIYGTAKNTFTLGFSVIPVDIYLYSADDAEMSSNLRYENHAHCDDLNMGDSIYTFCLATSGKYYVCKIIYKIDNGASKEIYTSVYYYE